MRQFKKLDSIFHNGSINEIFMVGKPPHYENNIMKSMQLEKSGVAYIFYQSIVGKNKK